MKRSRPKHLNLFVIRQPIPAIVSILHRISGAGLFLAIPALLWLFGASVDAEREEELRAVLAWSVGGLPLVKLVLLGLVWAYLHHFCAGMRFLLLDLHIGIELKPARASSWIVLAVSLTLTVILGVALW